MKGAGRLEILRVAAWLTLCVLIGLSFNQPLVWFCIGLTLYLGWQLWQLSRLLKWLKSPQDLDVPESNGLWGEIFSNLYQQQTLNQKGQRQLARMLNEFQASTAALPDAVIVLDRDDHIAWCNEAAVSLIGLHIPNDIGQRVVNLLRHPAFVSALIREDYDTDILLPSPLHAQQTLSLRIVSYGEGQKLVMARDVSQREQMERSRRDFVANASHELRTPLTVIRGYLEMMADESKDAKPLQPWAAPLSEMSQQAARMSRIIEDLLKLARIESHASSGKEEWIDVPRMLSMILAEARALSAGRHQIIPKIQPKARLRGHSAELQSAFANLIFNAVHYTPEGGELRVSWSADATGAEFSVVDNGVGIEQKHIPRLTERFYRADAGRSRETGGTGLGLAIVKHALEHHGSVLEIASELNVGSTFSCRFPISRLSID